LKKIIFTTAVLGASAVASAQTNVTIYGVVDAGIAYENNGVASVTRLDSGNLNGSRIGFKGSEDLGGGLAAAFQLENGFAVDTGTLGQGGLLFGRQAWIGLNGGFGALRLGRQVTGFFANSDTFDPFENSLAGDSERLFNYFGDRTNNTISYGYETNGFRTRIQYGLGEVAGNSAAGRTVSAWGGYRQGPADAVLIYQKTNDAIGSNSARTTLLGGNYDFNAFRLYAAYAWNKGVQGRDVDTRDALFGARVQVGDAGALIASWIRKSNKTIANGDADQIALGYVYDLSKRTALYASVSRTGNDSGASYNAAAPGATDKLFNAGIRHRF